MNDDINEGQGGRVVSTYEPALCMRLRASHAGKARLYVVLAADGTPLDAMEDTLHSVPVWVMHLVLLPEVDVTPAVYRRWQRDYAAVRCDARLARQGLAP
jgi:hypothetical protein